jgi:hypothetical protein
MAYKLARSRSIFQAMFVVLLLVISSPVVGAELGSYYTGRTLLTASSEQQSAYLAGLADSLVGLYRAQLVDGFLWFERCVGEKTPPEMLSAVKSFMKTNHARLDEPVANNFIWAMAAVCKYPVK